MAAQVNIEGRPARPSFLQVPLHTSSDRGVWGCGCSSPALVATFLVALSSILSIVKELTFLYICSSRSRGPAAAAGGRTSPRPPPLRQTEPRGTRNAPDKFWSAVGGFISGVGGPGQGRAAPKLERVEFPAFAATQGGPAGALHPRSHGREMQGSRRIHCPRAIEKFALLT